MLQLITTLLILCVFAAVRCQHDLFKVQKRRCLGQITYLSKPHEGSEFAPYVTLSGTSEEDCARKCLERTDFCTAIKFLANERKCQFSYHYISCKREFLVPTNRFNNGRIIYCMRCENGFDPLPDFKISENSRIQNVPKKDVFPLISQNQLSPSDYANQEPQFSKDLHDDRNQENQVQAVTDPNDQNHPNIDSVGSPNNVEQEEPIFSPWNPLPKSLESEEISVTEHPDVSNPWELAPKIEETTLVQQLSEELLEYQEEVRNPDSDKGPFSEKLTNNDTVKQELKFEQAELEKYLEESVAGANSTQLENREPLPCTRIPTEQNGATETRTTKAKTTRTTRVQPKPNRTTRVQPKPNRTTRVQPKPTRTTRVQTKPTRTTRVQPKPSQRNLVQTIVKTKIFQEEEPELLNLEGASSNAKLTERPKPSPRKLERRIVKSKTLQKEELEILSKEGGSRNAKLYLTANPSCDRDRLKPCLYGFGNGCKVKKDPEHPECHVCTCPYRSAARGCAGTYGLSDEDRNDLIAGRKLCPNGQRAQALFRWHRQRNECVTVKTPYCGYEMDISRWRMPRTKKECEKVCFSPEEHVVTSGFLFDRN